VAGEPDVCWPPWCGEGVVSLPQDRRLLRSRVGDDVVISAEDRRIFGYAGTAEAEHAAREVLAQQNLTAAVRFERWDPSGQVWRDARAWAPGGAVAEQPDTGDDDPEQGRLQSAAAALAGGVVQAVIDGIFP
jgi:hypothetical protein